MLDNIDFKNFMKVITADQPIQMESSLTDKVYNICVYQGLFVNSNNESDRINNINQLVATIQTLMKKSVNVFSKDSTQFKDYDFQALLDTVYQGKTVLNMPNLQIEQTYNAGVYNSLFKEKNYGFEDRKNSVSLFVSTLQGLLGKASEIAVAPIEGLSVEEAKVKLQGLMKKVEEING